MMKHDILNRNDIITLINNFYTKVKQDQSIGYFFTDVAAIDWDHHLPQMYDFWENIIFYTNTYEGNPMQKHQDIHKKSPMKMQHFQRWNQLFSHTVDELFEGEKAELIKQRASSISTVMQIKIFS